MTRFVVSDDRSVQESSMVPGKMSSRTMSLDAIEKMRSL